MSIVWSEGIIHDVEIRPLKTQTDSRGWLSELFRRDELKPEQFPAMCYVSETLPGVTRGPHEHVEQTDFFVFFGPGELKLYLWDNRSESPTYCYKMIVPVGASHPTAVIVPPGVVHAYRCVSEIPALTLNAPNQLYAGKGKKEKVDEIRHENKTDSPFVLDE
ncbi:MAG: dTDP-4-dehydrorhamnose 3,5-epimerase family protein [Planctomycetaceae bacterium]|jgi:dTDP-4-dehydrorhamnose 3,5-epimerase|nr:dTDP-4-dehydrorhamnose 3,5-epimerase family protein [Planctomycetaceae bacterium]